MRWSAWNGRFINLPQNYNKQYWPLPTYFLTKPYVSKILPEWFCKLHIPRSFQCWKYHVLFVCPIVSACFYFWTMRVSYNTVSGQNYNQTTRKVLFIIRRTFPVLFPKLKCYSSVWSNKTAAKSWRLIPLHCRVNANHFRPMDCVPVPVLGPSKANIPATVLSFIHWLLPTVSQKGRTDL